MTTNYFQEIDDEDVILDSDVEGEEDGSDDGQELVLTNKPQQFDDDSGILTEGLAWERLSIVSFSKW